MDFGIAGTMMMNVAEPQLRHDSVAETHKQSEIDDSQVEMLELEIEDLTLELEKEKDILAKERAANETHREELQQARTGIACFQQLLKERDTQLRRVQDELAHKTKQLIDAEEELTFKTKQLVDTEEELTFKTKQLVDTEEELTFKTKQLVDTEEELVRGQQSIEELRRSVEDTRQTNQSSNPFISLEERRERPNSGLDTETLTAELQACQKELANKSKEMDTLRGYLRTVEARKVERRISVQEDESEMAKQMKIKDGMINRYTVQIEELQAKSKRIPQFTAQAAKSEASIATLKSQRSALNEKLKEKTKLFEQKERIMSERATKLEDALVSVEAQALSAKNAFENDLHSLKASKDGLEQEVKARREQVSKLMSEASAARQDFDNGAKALRFDMETRLKEQKAKTTKLEKSLKALSTLKEENKRLRHQISGFELDAYGARSTHSPNSSSTIGIVFCVDLSGSLSGAPETLAKNTFKQLLNHLQAVYPNTYIGIVVQSSSTFVLRELSTVWSSDVTVLDSIQAAGTEDYTNAFTLVSALFTKFQSTNPGATRRTIMISDGEDSSQCADISGLRASGITYHNLVVDKGGSNCDTCSTAVYSSETGGRSILCNNITVADMEMLLGPR